MAFDWVQFEQRSIWFCLSLGFVFLAIGLFTWHNPWGELIGFIGRVILFITMVVACCTCRCGRPLNNNAEAALVPYPQQQQPEIEDDDDKLKEDILRILCPGIQVDEESNVLKDLMEGSEQEDGDDSFTCAICLDPIVPGDLVVSGASCSHVYHRPCIIQWLMKKRLRPAGSDQKHNSCPTCRSPMWTDEEYEKAKAAATAARDNQNKDEEQEQEC